MRVFITGATGFIGSAVVRSLVHAGHEVTGLVRSANAAASLEALGARACRGSIEDLHVLRRAAAAADGVIHTAFFHALSQASPGTRVRILIGGRPTNIVERFTSAAVGAERRAIETFGGALEAGKGSLVIAFPTMAMAQGVRRLKLTPLIPARWAGSGRNLKRQHWISSQAACMPRSSGCLRRCMTKPGSGSSRG